MVDAKLAEKASQAMPQISQSASALTKARLTAANWRFGKVGQHPWAWSLRFWPDGKVTGFRQPAKRGWDLQDGALKIFNPAGQLLWLFDEIIQTDNVIRLTGHKHRNPAINTRAILVEVPQAAKTADDAPLQTAVNPPFAEHDGKADDMVKLVIWDLDDTFWHGTLAEGGITPIQANIDMVKTLNERGIVNSICSKNHFDVTKEKLVELGIWDYFIFPRIEFAPKGAMIKSIIEAAQLRTPSVLFIDDNPVNINEAQHYNPKLQVCDQFAIPNLLSDQRLKGKPDPEMKRLANYKILEKKASDQASAGNDNLEFLRQSDIRVSFHHDVEAEFPRIHDLVNRSNQLNFTKLRWPEDEAAALAEFRDELSKDFHSHSGYVKVSDRYGNYGIVGFYMTIKGRCRHYLFSCRTLNMGVEQFVWQKLNRPGLKIVGEVVASLGSSPDWLSVVDDADQVSDEPGDLNKSSICIRGACDLSMMTHYLRVRFNTSEEFPFPFQGWGIHPAARIVALHREVNTPAGAALMARMPGMPAGRFKSSINTASDDVYVLSFSSEIFGALYRSKSTDMILPFESDFMGKNNFAAIPFEKIEIKAKAAGLTEAEWMFMQNEFELHGVMDMNLLEHDVRDIFSKLQGKIVIVLMLNSEVGRDKWVLNQFRKINSVVRPLVESFGYDTLELSEFIRTTDDLIAPTDSGAHFSRDVYRKLAKRVTEIVTTSQPAQAAFETLLA